MHTQARHFELLFRDHLKGGSTTPLERAGRVYFDFDPPQKLGFSSKNPDLSKPERLSWENVFPPASLADNFYRPPQFLPTPLGGEG